MKKLSVLLAVLAIAVNPGFSQKIKGSDTVLPLAQKEAESYAKINKNSDVTVTGGGSGVGISALLDGTTDIAMASRKIKFEERAKLQQEGKSAVETLIAYDALAVVVNPAYKVSKLTREQLVDIFTGKITNWKEVGGDDMKIVVYSRETSSGTYEFFKESVLKNKNYMPSILSMPATRAIIQSVSQTKGAIGYVGLAYLNTEVKPLSVSYDGANYVVPSFENGKNKTYPIVRPLYFYTVKDNNKVKNINDYMMTEQGQKIVKEVGYIPVK